MAKVPERKASLGSWFPGMWLILIWLHMLGQSTMAVGVHGTGVSQPQSGEEAEGDRERLRYASRPAFSSLLPPRNK